MVQDFYKKVLGIEEKEIKTREQILADSNNRLIRIAAALVLSISMYWLIVDRFSADYNLSVYAKAGVLLQVIFSVYMLFIPALTRKVSWIFIRISYVVYYAVVIFGMAVITLSRNLNIIASGDISSNIGVSVSAFYMFMLVLIPLPGRPDSLVVLGCMVVGLITPELLAHTSTYSMFSYILLTLCFTVTYSWYRRILLRNGERENEIDRLNLMLLQHSNVDSLTEILNRRSLDSYLEYIREKTDSRQIGVIFFDIDYFKKYNDYYGHVEGDAALREVAQAALSSIPESMNGYLFRYGGEEFIAVLENADEAMLLSVMKSIRDGIYEADIHRADVEEFDRVTVTMGGALEKMPNETGDYVMEADNQLYVGKRSERNRFYFEDRCVG